MAERKILLVDDDESVRLALGRFLDSKGYAHVDADGVAAVRELLRGQSVDAAIVDFSLPDGDGLDVLRTLKAQDASLPVLRSRPRHHRPGGQGDQGRRRAVPDQARGAAGAPGRAGSGLDASRMRNVSLARKTSRARRLVDPFFGESPIIRRLAAEAERVAPSPLPLLIRGETGTGKGVLARWIHQNGPRADEPFVDLNCAGLSRELLETELFGHEKGAFTGAIAAKQGLLEIAHRGTLFLDEIGDVDLLVQAKLLKVVEDLRFRRLGDVRDRQVDGRLVAATHQDLGRLVQEKKFRADLFYRISTLPLVMPPLRERGRDVVLLARRLMETVGAELGRAGVRLSPSAETSLAARGWPGNVRELRNVLERAILLSDSTTLEASHLGESDARIAVPTEQAQSGGLTLAEAERRHIEAVLREAQGVVPRAAEVLGLSRSALYERIKKHGLAVRKSAAS